MLKSMKFRAYYKQPRIVHQRHTYLRRMRRNRTEERPVVYLDETWANAHDGKSRAWVEDNKVTRGTNGRVRLMQLTLNYPGPTLHL